MRETIAYVLYTTGDNMSRELHNDRFDILIIMYNPATQVPIFNSKLHTIYVDATFTHSTSGKEAIQMLVKPCCRELYYI